MRDDNKTTRAVPVDVGKFTECTFKGAVAKEEFNRDRNAPKVQKTRGGVPVWMVKVSVSIEHNGRTDDDFLLVSVPSEFNPAERFQRGEDVIFEWLQYGIADTKTGYSLWFSADSINAAGEAASSPVRAVLGAV